MQSVHPLLAPPSLQVSRQCSRDFFKSSTSFVSRFRVTIVSPGLHDRIKTRYNLESRAQGGLRCGHNLSMLALRSGERVLDLGCGRGQETPGCFDCRYNVICGGGCGVVAANRTGEILAPDCRPVQELIELGVNYYLDEILALSEAVG